MPALDKLNESTRNSILTLPVEVNATAPFHMPNKPLAHSRVAIVTSAGLHVRGDKPFTSGDPTYRCLPSDTSPAEIVQSHASIGFDRTGIIEDINVVYPIDRLHEMVKEGRIGSLAASFYSFMGAQRDVSKIKADTAPAVAALLLADNVDVVLLTPT
jgi:D-proline reductase (dithiol) PrdB